jgi:hypothetical protein
MIRSKLFLLQGLPVGRVNAMQPACSDAASADSLMSAKTEPVLCFMAKQIEVFHFLVLLHGGRGGGKEFEGERKVGGK